MAVIKKGYESGYRARLAVAAFDAFSQRDDINELFQQSKAWEKESPEQFFSVNRQYLCRAREFTKTQRTERQFVNSVRRFLKYQIEREGL